MQSLNEFHSKIKILLTDIDDTLTDVGKLHAPAYEALWKLAAAGVRIIPVTGRPAGWCEMIARLWPVWGVIGENGALCFHYDAAERKMSRLYFEDPAQQATNRQKLAEIEREVLRQVPGTAVASDQFSRLFDLAIDFCEDVAPLDSSSQNRILEIFRAHGAVAKLSSIHVNGWFGHYDKLSMSLRVLRDCFGLVDAEMQDCVGFVGDSPNDEPMWRFFRNSFGVANVGKYIGVLKNPPNYVASARGGAGFVEIAARILDLCTHNK